MKLVYSILIETIVGKIQAKTLEQLQALYARAELLGLTDEIDKHIFMRQLDQEVINKALVLLIVIRNLPFRFVEWPKTHTLF